MTVHRGKWYLLDWCFLCESGWQLRSGMNWEEQRAGKEPTFAFTEVITHSLLACSLSFSKSGVWPLVDISICSKTTSGMELTYSWGNQWKMKLGIKDPWGTAAQISMVCSIYTIAYKIEIHRAGYYNRIKVFTKYIKILLIKKIWTRMSQGR